MYFKIFLLTDDKCLQYPMYNNNTRTAYIHSTQCITAARSSPESPDPPMAQMVLTLCSNWSN